MSSVKVLARAGAASISMVLMSVGVATAVSAQEYAGGPAIGLGIGTLGITAELSARLSSQFVARVNGSWLGLDLNRTVDGNDYNVKARAYGVGLIGDWHPFANGFRLSAGVRYHVADFKGTVGSGDIDLNGTTYTEAEYGRLQGRLQNGNRVAPYIGLGWDSTHFKDGNWSFSSEIGALYVGDPKITLTTTAGTGNAALQADLAAEATSIKSEYGKFGRFWPVVQFAAKYRF